MRVVILTISDSVSRGVRGDASGPALRERCLQLGWDVVAQAVLPDEPASIRERLVSLVNDGPAELIFTTCGTGSLPEIVAGNPRSDARVWQEKESARGTVPGRGGNSGKRADRQFAGEPARRGRVARLCFGTAAARARSVARRAARFN